MIPLSYTVRNIVKHKMTSLLTIFGVALVVFVFSGANMLSYGLRSTLVATGYEDNVIAIRRASQTEVVSIIDYEQAQIVSALPQIAKDADGKPLFTTELFVLVNMRNRKGGGEAQVVARGVTPRSLTLRPKVKLIAGRMWSDGGSEIIAGKSASDRFIGCGLGEKVKFGGREWTVVGIFDAQGSGFDSEIWVDVRQLSDAFRRPIYSSLTFRLNDPGQFQTVKEQIENDRRLPLDVKREPEYYAAQSRTLSAFISIAGTVISIVFSLGAIVGAMITMYAAVANRTREIGTLRSLGFSRFSILAVFLFESIVISFSGGALGVAAAFFLRYLRISTINWDTFSELAFNLNISPGIVVSSLIFAVVMGLVGGFLPAVRAARLNILDSLRAA